MKIQPVSISKQLKPPPGMDYKMLQKEGLDLLQQLAGEVWTDYNAHDPGVTILEYLCYALTDLSYKTHFDLRDILEQHPSRNSRLSDSFYPAYKVLNSHPVTVNDYRKLLLDRFYQQIRNVWVTPVNSFNNRLVSGQYQVSIQLKSEIYEENNAGRQQQICDEVWTFLRGHRSLGEDFPKPEILQPQEIYVEALIDVHPEADIDKVYAQIFLGLEQNIVPETRFHSFHELWDAGYAIEDIFEGTFLDNGFILNTDLCPPCTKIYISSLLKSIFGVEGVQHIRQFELSSEGIPSDAILTIEEGKIPLLLINIKKPELPRIRIFKSGVEVFVNAFSVYREIEYIRAKNRRLFPFDLAKDPQLNASRGVRRNLHEYPSIQDEFPLVYGIGPYGLPSSSSDARKTQALQLKAYLLAFEQVMANYLAQLSGTNYLFSFNEHLTHTRFTQPITQLSGISNLIQGHDAKIPKSNVRHPAFIQNYRKVLNKVWHHTTEYAGQRLKMLDHLLARFGEAFDERLLDNLDYYLGADSLNKAKIRIKTNYLKQLPVLGSDRARATGPVTGSNRQDWEPSGLEKRMRYHLGLLKTNQKSPLALLRYSQVDISSLVPETQTEKVNVAMPAENAGMVKLKHIEHKEHHPHRTDIKKLKPGTRLFNDLKNPDHDFFLNGIEENNYYLKVISDAAGREVAYELQYISPVTDNRTLTIGSFQSWDKAVQEFQSIISYLKRLHISTEGYRMVEHLLLAPSPEHKCYSLELRDEERDVLLKTQAHLSQTEMGKHMHHLLSKPKDALIILPVGGQFELFSGSPQQKICVHPQRFSDESQAETMRNKIMQLLAESKSGGFNPLHFFAHVGGKAVPSPFFSSQITVVFPAISARFNDEEFRMLAEQRFIEETPAHVYLNFLWLPANEYEHFEKLYDIWQSAMLTDMQNTQSRINLAEWLFEQLDYPEDIVG